MLMFSILFLGIGLLFEFIGIGMCVAMATGGMDFNWLVVACFVLMPIIFIVIGAISLSKDLKERSAKRNVAKNGRTTYAKVFDIRTTAGVEINGMMPEGIHIRYFDAQGRINNDMIKIEADDSHYGTISIGETLEIKELDGKCILVRELENLPFEGSDVLIDPTISAYGEGATNGVNCPSCGGLVNVAPGCAAFCSHCGFKVRLDAEGKIVNDI